MRQRNFTVRGTGSGHTGNMTSDTSDRTVLYGISSRAWEHPADRGALVAVRKLRGFDMVVRRLSALVTERAVRLMLLGSAIRVDERQFTRLHDVYTEACTVLDVEQAPELYVVANPFLNAQTIGLDKPVIVVNSALLYALDDDELRFVLGHELGHVASGHAVYRTILLLLTTLSTTFLSIPLGGLGLRAIMAALTEWYRKSELSCDRAGLLAAQDPDAAKRALTRGRFLFQAAMGGTLGVVLVCLIQALYFFLVSKLAGYEVQDYGRWFSFSVWTYFPNVLAYLTAGVAYLLSSRQTDFFAIDVTNLNTLLFRLSPHSRWFSLAASIHLTTFWWLALMIMGFSLWTKKSPGKSAFIVLAPWLTIYAVFALVKLI